MTVEGGKPATYPMWIGNLEETATEMGLKRAFSRFTQSKKSGYVNFLAEAETAAKAMAGSKIVSVPIKTKGPSILRKEHHLDQSMDHRPITDCSFYMITGNCKKEQVRLCECVWCACVLVRVYVHMACVRRERTD